MLAKSGKHHGASKARRRVLTMGYELGYEPEPAPPGLLRLDSVQLGLVLVAEAARGRQGSREVLRNVRVMPQDRRGIALILRAGALQVVPATCCQSCCTPRSCHSVGHRFSIC